MKCFSSIAWLAIILILPLMISNIAIADTAEGRITIISNSSTPPQVPVTSGPTTPSYSSSTTTSTGSSGGGLSGVSAGSLADTAAKSYEIIWFELKKGQRVSSTMNVLITNVTFTSEAETSVGRMKLTVLEARPQNTTSLENVYKYIRIKPENIILNNAILEFKIPNKWMNDYNNEFIVLSRYTTRWDDLPTRYKRSDENYTYFQSTTPGFSDFAIRSTQYAQNKTIQQIITGNVIGDLTQSSLTQASDLIDNSIENSKGSNDELSGDAGTGGIKSGQSAGLNQISGQRKSVIAIIKEKVSKMNLQIIIAYALSFSMLIYAITFVTRQVANNGQDKTLAEKKGLNLKPDKKIIDKKTDLTLEEEVILDLENRASIDDNQARALAELSKKGISKNIAESAYTKARAMVFIKKARISGMNDEEIRRSLFSVGWKQEIIDECYEEIKKGI